MWMPHGMKLDELVLNLPNNYIGLFNIYDINNVIYMI